jgi:L-ribulose-5-phosphate 4-epimerase
VSETGAVKFVAERATAAIPRFAALTELNTYRTKLRQLGLLGVDASGIGFGNISLRDGSSAQFYITASASGDQEELGLADCPRVVAWDFASNWLRFEGPAMASSESLTHAAIYEADENIRAIIHGHSLKLWTTLLRQAPATPADVEYGTPEMARAVRDLFETTNVREKRVFAMAGHREGIMAFGRHLSDAYAALLGELQPGATG